MGKQAAAEGILEPARTDGTDLESCYNVDILAEEPVAETRRGLRVARRLRMCSNEIEGTLVIGVVVVHSHDSSCSLCC